MTQSERVQAGVDLDPTTVRSQSDTDGGRLPRRRKNQDRWAGRMASTVAAEVRRWRRQRQLSAQQLSDATKRLGYHVPRAVITNLENGRRDSIDIAELLVLGAALNVPPLVLVTPVGHQEMTEILPNLITSSWLARGWVLGALPMAHAEFSDTAFADGRAPIAMYDIHASLLKEHERLRESVRLRLEARGRLVASGPHQGLILEQETQLLEVLASEFSYSLDRIRSFRESMVQMGLVLPDLPADILDSLHGSPAPRGRHRVARGGNELAGELAARTRFRPKAPNPSLIRPTSRQGEDELTNTGDAGA
jgi:transcriptional regulator with XRE-family HTH domain